MTHRDEAKRKEREDARAIERGLLPLARGPINESHVSSG